MRVSYAFYTDKLQGDYRTVFDKIEIYVGTQSFDDIEKEEKLSQLLDVFLSAQEVGKPVAKIVGDDIEKFCKTFCSDSSFKNKVISFLDSFKNFALFVLIFSVLDLLSADSDFTSLADTTSSINISGCIIAIFISEIFAFITSLVISKVMFKLKRISMSIFKIAIFVIAAIMFVGTIFVIVSNNTNFINLPAQLTLICSSVYLLVYYAFNYKRLKATNYEKIKFSDLVNTQMRENLNTMMSEKFNNINKRNAKRGKATLTMEEFLDKDEDDCNKILKSKMFYFVLPIVITVLAFVSTYLTSGFEGFIDAVIFLAITIGIEYPIMISIWKFWKNSALNRKAWIKEKREELKSK